MLHQYEQIAEARSERNVNKFNLVAKIFAGVVALLLISVALFYGENSGTIISSNLFAHTTSQKNEIVKNTVMPNFVFILADDVGWNNIGSGREFFVPSAFENLGMYARKGMILKNYYAQELCTPSRASLLTGRYPLSVGLAYTAIGVMENHALNIGETTIANVLQDNGYKTHMLGKWHLGHYSPDHLPSARGFDTSLGYTQGENCYWSKINPQYTDYTDFLKTNSTCYEPYRLNDSNTFSTHLYRDKAVEIINAHDQTSPLYMYLPFQAAHSPFYDFNGDFDKGIPDQYIAGNVLHDINETAGLKKKQYGMSISILDRAVVDIIEALEQSGLMDNTYLIFASDNGGCYIGGGSNGPLRGSKASLFEGGVKVDAFVYSPLLRPELQGSSYQGLFHVSDWFPTILELAGIPYSPAPGYALDGVSQVAGWGDHSTTVSTGPRTKMLYNWYTDVEDMYFDIWTNGTFAVRNDRFKLIHSYNNSNSHWFGVNTLLNSNDDDISQLDECFNNGFTGDFDYFLFDLWEDPYERHNLYASKDTVHVEAKESLYAYLSQHTAGSIECVGTNCELDSTYIYSVWDDHDKHIVPWAQPSGTGKNVPKDCYQP